MDDLKAQLQQLQDKILEVLYWSKENDKTIEKRFAAIDAKLSKLQDQVSTLDSKLKDLDKSETKNHEDTKKHLSKFKLRATQAFGSISGEVYID